MAVLIEGLSVVIRCEAIVKKFFGGVNTFMDSLPNLTLCSDGELACVHFMVPRDVQTYVEYLTRKGLTFKENNKSIDMVVVDQIHGMTIDCDWAVLGETDWNNNANHTIVVCCAEPTRVEQMFHLQISMSEGGFLRGRILKGSLMGLKIHIYRMKFVHKHY
ncbi:hypothetical protein RND59_00645 [Vibrio ruber]|uniref:hypothetical protein n=1 Tax=Vibrio ruber TaxID=184755 RepID=UPI002892FEA1|nr:hypothetical protein [Vibrio ruber]WNJ95665.1 hypothetical protein RND59_00645 [Vibrio ruber]